MVQCLLIFLKKKKQQQQQQQPKNKQTFVDVLSPIFFFFFFSSSDHRETEYALAQARASACPHARVHEFSHAQCALLATGLVVGGVVVSVLVVMVSVVVQLQEKTVLLSTKTRGVTVSMSAFLACHRCYCAGSSLAWGLHLRAVVCGIF